MIAFKKGREAAEGGFEGKKGVFILIIGVDKFAHCFARSPGHFNNGIGSSLDPDSLFQEFKSNEIIRAERGQFSGNSRVALFPVPRFLMKATNRVFIPTVGNSIGEKSPQAAKGRPKPVFLTSPPRNSGLKKAESGS